jgi:hypothetical protein
MDEMLRLLRYFATAVAVVDGIMGARLCGRKTDSRVS